MLCQKILELLCPETKCDISIFKQKCPYLNADFSLNWSVIKDIFSKDDLTDCKDAHTIYVNIITDKLLNNYYE